MARLGDICEIAAGQGAPQGENSYCNCNEGIPFIKAGDLSDLLAGKLETEIQCVNEIVAKQHKLKLYPAGSILFAKSGMSCMKGYVYRTKNPCYIVSHLAIVIPQGIDGEYLKYYFQHNKPNALIKDSAYPSISLQDISNIELTVPSLDIQASIASELNKVNMLISFRKQQLSKLDELLKSRFIEMFGDPKTNAKEWKMNTFADICSVRQGLQIPISKRLTQYEEGCYEYITVAYLHGSKEREYIKNPKNTVICTKDDILMTRTGNTGMVITDVAGVFHNNFFLIDFDRIRYNKVFLAEYLNLDLIQAEIRRRAGTSTIPDLNHGEFYAIAIYEPPIELQDQFASFVEQIDKSKFEIQKSLEKLETLKKALMQKYFG